MADYELDEIRRIRREISARFDHDVSKLVEHYQAVRAKIPEVWQIQIRGATV